MKKNNDISKFSQSVSYTQVNCIILQGLPRSGKTTWAKQFMQDYNVKNVHYNLVSDVSAQTQSSWSAQFEKTVKSYLRKGMHIIWDDCNVDNGKLQKFIQMIEAFQNSKNFNGNIAVQIVSFMHVSIADCFQRMGSDTNILKVSELVNLYKIYQHTPIGLLKKKKIKQEDKDS